MERALDWGSTNLAFLILSLTSLGNDTYSPVFAYKMRETGHLPYHMCRVAICSYELMEEKVL